MLQSPAPFSGRERLGLRSYTPSEFSGSSQGHDFSRHEGRPPITSLEMGRTESVQPSPQEVPLVSTAAVNRLQPLSPLLLYQDEPAGGSRAPRQWQQPQSVLTKKGPRSPQLSRPQRRQTMSRPAPPAIAPREKQLTFNDMSHTHTLKITPLACDGPVFLRKF